MTADHRPSRSLEEISALLGRVGKLSLAEPAGEEKSNHPLHSSPLPDAVSHEEEKDEGEEAETAENTVDEERKAASSVQAFPDLHKGKHFVFHKLSCTYPIIHECVKNLNWKSLNQPNNFSLMWIDTCAGLTESFGLIKPWQMVNHIPGLNELLARKSRLYRNLHRVAQILPRE